MKIEDSVSVDQPVDTYLSQCYAFTKEALQRTPLLGHYLLDDDDWAYIEDQWMRRYWRHHHPSLLSF